MNTLPESGLDAREERVRAIAHAMWEGEGQPEDRAEEHWLAACAIVAAEAESPAWLKYAKPLPEAEAIAEAKTGKEKTPRLDEEIARQLATAKVA